MDINLRIQEYATAHGMSVDDVAATIRAIGDKIKYYGNDDNIFNNFGEDGADLAEFTDYFQKIDGKSGREVTDSEIALLYDVLNADGGNLSREELSAISSDRTATGEINARGIWSALLKVGSSSAAAESAPATTSSDDTAAAPAASASASSSSSTTSTETEQKASPYEFSTSKISDITEKGLTVDGNNILDAQGRKVGTVLHENKDINGDGKVDDVKTYALFSTAMIPAGQDWTNSGDGTYADETGRQMISVASTDPRVAKNDGTYVYNDNGDQIGRVANDPETGVTFFYLYADSGVVTQDELAEVNADASGSTQSAEAKISDEKAEGIADEIKEAIDDRDLGTVRSWLNDSKLSSADKVKILSSMGDPGEFLQLLCNEYDNIYCDEVKEFSELFTSICVDAAKAGNEDALELIAGSLHVVDYYGIGGCCRNQEYNQFVVDAFFANADDELVKKLDKVIQTGKADFKNAGGHRYSFSNLDDFLHAYKDNSKVKDKNKASEYIKRNLLISD